MSARPHRLAPIFFLLALCFTAWVILFGNRNASQSLQAQVAGDPPCDIVGVTINDPPNAVCDIADLLAAIAHFKGTHINTLLQQFGVFRLRHLVSMIRQVQNWQPPSGSSSSAPVFQGKNIGMNFGPHPEYRSYRMYSDITHLTRVPFNQSWVPGTFQLTTDGYPMDQPYVLMFDVPGYPAGTYKLSAKGKGTIVSKSGPCIQVKNVQAVGGSVTADVVFTSPAPQCSFVLGITPDTQDPIRAMRVMAPGYDVNSPLFTPEFLHRLKPFSTLRAMNLLAMNSDNAVINPLVEWAERPTMEHLTWTSSKGMPLEAVIAMANAAKKNIWVNVPVKASEDYMRQMARLFRDTLDPALTAYVEYGNELWNWSFAGTVWLKYDSANNTALSFEPDLNKRLPLHYAYRTKRMSDIWKEEFGSQKSRIVIVFGGQAAGEAKPAFDFIKNTYGPPSQYFDAVAIAPYAGVESDKVTADMTLDQLFAMQDDYLVNKTMVWTKRWKTFADSHGLPLISYEGGQGSYGHPLLVGMQNDPRMYAFYHKLVSSWEKETNGALFMQYAFVGTTNAFDVLNSIDEPGTQKWQALLSLSLPPGDVNLDRKVTYADFLILKTNFGQSGKWWEQGDSNNDRMVNGVDVQAMCAHFDGSASEKTEVCGFGG